MAFLLRMFPPPPANRQNWRDEIRAGLDAQVRDHAAKAEKLSASLAEHLAASKVLCLCGSGTIAPMCGTYANALQGPSSVERRSLHSRRLAGFIRRATVDARPNMLV